MKIKEFRKGDKVKINIKYLKMVYGKFSGKDKEDFALFIKNDGVVTIIEVKKGYIFYDEGMRYNTQYLIDKGWRIGVGGIPLNKITKIDK